MITRKLRMMQIQLTLSLLLAFSGVFICNALCDLGILDIRMYSDQTASLTHHSNENKHSHDHHGDSDHHNDPQAMVMHQDEHNHVSDQHRHKDKDECCEEETLQLLASLVNYELPTFQTERVPVLLQTDVLDQDFIDFISNKKSNVYSLNSSLSPPISGFQLRILYQSFLC
jgi:hypothetical protein|tara:strand:- start:15133 stop:15645 length:513 start_codon:yes stop_codon:yes gene_type:complete